MNLADKIRGFDLNLLAVFAAIDEYRHITKAAKVLRMTQPALSHALARLRILMDDDLFVKSSKGMVPTPRASQLSQPVRSILSQFERDILGVEDFVPEKMQKVFRIHTTDLIDSLLLPALLKIFEKQAPKSRIISLSSPFALPREELEMGKSDLAVAGFFGNLPHGFYQQKLFSDVFVSAVRKDHPRLCKKKELSLSDFCEERHLLVSPGGELHSQVDEILAKKKLNRAVVAGLNAFMSSAWVLPETDCILTAPSRLVEQMAKVFPLKIMTPPMRIPEITIVQVWHDRNHHDAGHRWFREHIRSILQT
ncbi:MAG: LysR family transcriptional regulator [Proteobacteria bacterium]|nr:LysR family transcriptional regulator [Pseudomonadota bacterium]